MEPLKPDHVQKILDSFNLGLEVLHFTETTFTSEDAAAAIGCRLGQIAKSMCLMAGGNPVLVIGAGDQRIADAKVAKYLGIGRKKIKLATSEECISIFGYPPGGVSPVGHRTQGIPIIIDKTLFRWDTVYTAAGTPHDNFAVTTEQLETITGGTVLDCMKDPVKEPS